jgi:uncharacterized OB-fold protein
MSATRTEAAFLERLRAFVGRSAGPQVEAPDAVNEAMIRHWCEALGDANPVYTDEKFASWSVHGGIVAPPTMLQVWTMRGMKPPAPPAENAQSELMAVLDEAGFTSIVATNCEQTYERYLRPGDVIVANAVIDEVSEEKRTGLGTGHFFSTLTTYCDQTGAVVGRMMQRYLKFRPPNPNVGAAVDTSPSARPRPAINQDTEFFWEGARRGELLIQRCTSCKKLRHPPRAMCGECGSLEWDTVRASGRGEVYSFVVYHHPPLPGFRLPYVVALVELEEGTRLVANMTDIEPAAVRIGMPVEVDFLAIDDTFSVPVFRPQSDPRS